MYIVDNNKLLLTKSIKKLIKKYINKFVTQVCKYDYIQR